jgi:multisubunit Na+/H+ antiporter MnhC subunit
MTEQKDEAQAQRQPEEEQNRLYPEDQAKVDAFVSRGINSVERKPFRPLRLLVILTVIVVGLSLFSQLLARWAGIY